MTEDPDHRVLLGAVRRRGWDRAGRGLYVPSDADPEDRVRAWSVVLPEHVVLTGLSAARLHRLWLPPLPDEVPVFVTTSAGHPRVRRPQVRCTTHPVPVARTRVGGARVATVPETLLACARDLEVLDLVVLVDSALQQGSCTAGDLAVVTGRGWAGSGRLREAVRFADGRSESAWETLLRILHVVVDADVVPQHVVTDDRGFVARGDLWLRGTRTLHEYDGADHRTLAGHRSDLRRDRAIVNAAWTRRGYTAMDVLHRAAHVLRDIDDALGREHRPARLKPWFRLLNASLFTPTGMERLACRWHLRV